MNHYRERRRAEWIALLLMCVLGAALTLLGGVFFR
jgi:hypothetical protein